MYDVGSKCLLVVSLPMLLGLWLTAHLVVGLWLGHVANEVYQAVMFLAFAYWLVIALAMSFSVGTGMGWSKPVMHSAILQALLNIGLSYVLIVKYGFIGALYGTVIAIAVANSILYYRFCKDFSRPLRQEMSRFVLVLKANVLPTVLCGMFVWGIDGWLVWGDRLWSGIILMMAIVINGTAYLFSLRVAQVFDANDMQLLGGKVPLLQKILGER